MFFFPGIDRILGDGSDSTDTILSRLTSGVSTSVTSTTTHHPYILSPGAKSPRTSSGQPHRNHTPVDPTTLDLPEGKFITTT